MKKYLSGFTLIELLVVIGIIAILSTLSVVYFETARMSARDARRLSDVKQIQLALKMYYNDLGYYPTAITAGNSIANGGTNYLLRIPSNPVPRADNGCPDQEYQYSQLEAGQRYSLGFCLGDKTDDLDAGIHAATHNGILNCPSGYVAVPGSYTFQTNDFCVMKYEAKCANSATPTIGISDPGLLTGNSTYDNSNYPCTEANSKLPVSASSGYPIGVISQADAITYCQTIGGHLLTNPEWMTIARNLEKVTTNWSNGAFGDGSLNIGNYSGAQVLDGSSIYGGGGQVHDSRRTSYLSYGDNIWDFTGNVSEWVDASCLTSNYYNSGGIVEWSDSNLDDYERPASGSTDSSFGKSQGVGQYTGCSVDSNIFLRGGSADESSGIAGIYGLDLSRLNSDSGNLSGFRCVK